jgi:hypothetical protein
MDELSKTYTLTHSPDGWRVHLASGIAFGLGLEPHYSVGEVIRHIEGLYPGYRSRLTTEQLAEHAFEADLAWAIKRDLARNLREHTMSGRPEELALLHHKLSELKAHVEVARREVALAKGVRQAGNGIGCEGHAFPPVNGSMRGFPGAKIAERRGMER